MRQYGFYFNQDRCLGCKTCIIACKNWNERRRGDALVSVFSETEYIVNDNELDTGLSDKGDYYSDGDTGNSNFDLYRQYYMKENWRRVECTEKGAVSIVEDNTFKHDLTRSYVSVGCNHCASPACVAACPVGLIYKDNEFGIVLNDNSACLSCGRCKDACPWSAPQFYREDYASFDTNDPARPRMTKCTGCLDRIRGGRKPACVAACWNHALDAGSLEDLKKKHENHTVTVEGFKSSYIEATGVDTEPSIIFKPKS